MSKLYKGLAEETMNPQQERIAQALHVQSVIDAKVTISEIVRFLSSYLIRSGARGYVLGISGGQDSTLCGKLAQLAVEDARHHSALPISFWAMHLPYGKQRKLEIARALATEPKVLLLDEALAGLTQRAVQLALDLVRDIHRSGITLVIVEHIMEVIMSLASRVVVFHQGKEIARGTPREVTGHPAVIEAYLGTKRAAAGGPTSNASRA